jgi:hypothetical protein
VEEHLCQTLLVSGEEDTIHSFTIIMVKGKISGSALRGSIALVCGAAFLVSLIPAAAPNILAESRAFSSSGMTRACWVL